MKPINLIAAASIALLASSSAVLAEECNAAGTVGTGGSASAGGTSASSVGTAGTCRTDDGTTSSIGSGEVQPPPMERRKARPTSTTTVTS